MKRFRQIIAILLANLIFGFPIFSFFTVESASEKEILLQFKANISNDPLKSLESWNPMDETPCLNWTGITCNFAGKVEKIILLNTQLAGVLPENFSGLESLRTLILSGNQFTGTVPSQYGDISSLWKLNLSRNALSGQIPSSIGNLASLRMLDLSRNSINGVIPSEIFQNCFKTRYISLSNNGLQGQIPLAIGNCTRLKGFDFAFNKLSGELPSQICLSLNMAYISLRNNSLIGSLLDKLSNCKSLEFLDLGGNSFSGSMPWELLSLSNLSYFDASHNKLQGQIPENWSCGGSIDLLDLSGNGLSGEIGNGVLGCRSIRVLDLGFNRFSGTIPNGISELKRLSVLRLSGNLLEGVIPVELGSIEFLQVLDLQDLNLVGTIPVDLGNCWFLLELDLSGNNITGTIPDTLYNMIYLKILDLHTNDLQGTIPLTLANLTNLKFLDLSNNFLSGEIPRAIGNLTQLTHLNLSSNNLSGPIPLSSTLLQFGPGPFLRNPNLCGPPLPTPCPQTGQETIPRARKTKLLTVTAIVAIVAAAAIFTGVCLITFMNIKARRRRRAAELMIVQSTPLSTESSPIIGKLVLFSKSLPSRYEDWEAGTKALLDKDCLIGGGTIGTVYKASFDNGRVSIAVKKLETLGRIKGQDEFEQEIGRLGGLNHPNLTPLQGYYWSSTMQLLLWEFIPNASLYDHLHKRRAPNWINRFKIALGAAKALAYLHHDCKPKVLHLNVKSSNILVDEEFNAKVSDYGLGKLMPRDVHGAAGYVAPELGSQGSIGVSEKCDVYGFGVVLLEVVSGKRSVERGPAGEVVVLREWVRSVLEGGAGAGACADVRMRGARDDEVAQVLKLGLVCTSDLAVRRPSMAEVVQVLESIRSGNDDHVG
ncbi:hypothetical protein AMTRI_Chr09g42300 [Amborella trichopoda]|uniref:probable LRR receptor-like serine/threonine-protein kinase At1g12460 n=1 Tax=Amborella trichopoda TaxID=13333 RepID=UPI0009BF88D2|nr:probable LRR receptor-like serine/threonine-protein kinase At1g12460 [Amborella trichopoda]|eukprot:XP_020531477.1 probable LRR receptor-like serine/threonine-protein kinase At1g12460 [Amborella trichopoda]